MRTPQQFLLLLLLVSLLTLSSANSNPRNRYPQMLEVSARPWLYTLQQQYPSQNVTQLRDIPRQELVRLRQQGFDVVWLMGVWALGDYGLQYDRTNPNLRAHYEEVLPGYSLDDVIGSPYAITEYTVNPALGTEADLAQFRSLLHDVGLSLMLDFVPNHSACDCAWTTQHPEYYVKANQVEGPYDSDRYLPNGVAFGWAGWGDSWQDTAQFNYWQPDFVQAMTETLLTVAEAADYIRCDMAFLALNDQIEAVWGDHMRFWNDTRPRTEFWATAIATVKRKYPAVQFLAEVYNPWQRTLQELGFDFTYDKELYDHLGDGNLGNLGGYIRGTPLTFHQHSAHFVSNHDEERAATYFGSNMRADGAAMASMTLPGMRFYWMGQRDGYFNQIDVHLRRAKPEPAHPGVAQFYNIFTALLARPIFHDGEWQLREVVDSDNSWRLLAWEWTLKLQKVLCVVNYSSERGFGRVTLPTVGLDGNVTLTELISNRTYARPRKVVAGEGLGCLVDAWSMQMFEYESAADSE